MTTPNDALLTEWKQAKELLDRYKSLESALRKQVVETFSHDAAPGHSGTENVDIGHGHTLKIVHALTYTLDNANNSEKLNGVLDLIEKSMEGGNIIAERLVKWKPELSVTEYKLLSASNKALIDTVLTIKDATPSVAIVLPK